jgi:uncharacterized membrane protein YgcG
VIRSLDNTPPVDPTTTSATTASPAPAADPSGKSFADLHTAAVSREKVAGAGASAKIVTPDGETWAPVKGDARFARIISGPRAGQYINLSRGERRGQAFTIEKRDGKTFHVYGSGSSEQSIEASKDAVGPGKKAPHATAQAAAHDRPPDNETWAPVDGHSSYADILNGKRNGLFVNISGGVRDGMSFQLVKHGDKVFHIYGTGKTRQVIEVKQHKADAGTKSNSTTSSSTTSSSSSTTGGASAGGGNTTA